MPELGDHPDVAAALGEGYPRWQGAENRSTAQTRREFAEEWAREFIDFALDGDPAILEGFTRHMGWKYESWLN